MLLYRLCWTILHSIGVYNRYFEERCPFSLHPFPGIDLTAKCIQYRADLRENFAFGLFKISL